MSKITFEICVDTPHGLKVAKQAGADRVELCSALAAGGLTPSRGLMRLAREIDMPAHVMIRPRDGDFCFSEDELKLMLDDIALAKSEKMQGVVLGATHADGTLDECTLKTLIDAANGMDLTLHRAFDVTPEPLSALETAIELGFDRILTSGQQTKASDGKDLLAEIVTAARGRIEIMPGSGVNAEVISHLAAAMPLTNIHASCAAPLPQSPDAAVKLGFAAEAGRRDASLKVAQKLALELSHFEGAAS
ncbi:copper homeostasis protein CutC [Maritalea myrionectae]|uniref:copper homeostasis protein CutC n=1 Tax=Maritalea myrionectae TaxID=454601 RepID=UPI000422B994|nr:copper homeostasis protein CutC [Maritalea myrionectae]